MREILTDMGFYSTPVLGVWKFSATLSPGNTLEVCVFVHGNFWVNEGGKRVYSNNYKILLIEEFIEALLRIIDKN